jgi:hypothetical protein
MQLNSIRNCKKKKKHYWLQKIEDYNLTKNKYFEYIQYLIAKTIKEATSLYAISHSVEI